MVHLNTVKQLFCVNIDQERKCSFRSAMNLNLKFEDEFEILVNIGKLAKKIC